MKYLSNNNNNHFFIKRKLKASDCLSNAHVTSCLAYIHKPKKALETKVNEIIGRDKKQYKQKHLKKNCDVISTIFL